MYSPPQSHLRRPWSPEPRRETSDASIDALDLADYARTLAPATWGTDSPSLESSNNTYHTAPLRPARRPFSLPPSNPSLSSHATSSQSRPHRPPRTIESNRIQSPSEEIDISHFPKWSHNWYNNKPTNNASSPDPDADIYTPVPPSSFDLAGMNRKSVFDPGYKHDPRNSDLYAPPLYSSVRNNSTRYLLPWSNDSPQYDEPPLEPALKEERMRMLEKEFGDKAKLGSKKHDPLVDEDGKPVVGTIDHQGRLVTVGPKKRIFIRVLQILLALVAAVPSIYAALVSFSLLSCLIFYLISYQAIKPSNPKDPPPPANKAPAYVLYIISVISVFILLYLFVIRQCCIRNKPSPSKHPLNASAMMVLPMNGSGGKKPQKSAGKGKKGQQGGDVQVNLIVDPTAFQHHDVSESEDSECGEDGGVDKGTKHKHRKRRHKRRGVFEGFAMEEQWLAARAWLKKMTMVDVAGLLIWGATFVFVLIGKRCPSGGFGGWQVQFYYFVWEEISSFFQHRCNAYNVSSAAACLLCVAFGVSIFFDVQDLHSSKQSPRTRT